MPDTALNASRDDSFELAFPRIDHSVIMVTPAMARRWLARNVRNRNLRQAVVERYRNDMLAGRWAFTGEPVQFDTDGNLQNGQHRLTALSEMDESVTIPMLVIRGLPSDAQTFMDQGSKRMPGDQLALKGIRSSTHVAATVKQYIVWTEDMLFRDTKVQSTISSARIEAWVDDHPDEVEFYLSILKLTKQNDAPPSIAGAASLGFALIDKAATVEFFTLLARGAGTQGHPIVTLDKRLQRIRREGLKVAHRDYLAFFIQAWNAWRDGRQMTKFQRPRGGTWNESNFPVPS